MFLHPGLAFVWEVNRGRGVNEIGHSFLCNMSQVYTPTWRARSADFVKVQYKMKYNKANETRAVD